MNTMLVTYKLDCGEAQYEAIAKLISELGETWHDRSFFESIWWLSTEKTTAEVRDHVVQAISPNGHLFVSLVTRWNSRYSRPLGDWLREHELA